MRSPRATGTKATAIKVTAAYVGLAASACERIAERADFERMTDQAYFRPYEATDLFPDGRVMRHPPPGTVAIDRKLDQPAFTHGIVDGAEVTAIPVPVDRALLRRGRDRFERFCGACHGGAGYGNPAIVENARLRPPPSLHEPEIVAQPPGRVFATITWGYGLMPSYRTQLPPHDRWAVVAYLEVLQDSQAVELVRLPAALRAEARAALREEDAR